MMRTRQMFLGIVFLSSVAGPVLAHHSAAMFDATQERVFNLLTIQTRPGGY